MLVTIIEDEEIFEAEEIIEVISEVISEVIPEAEVIAEEEDLVDLTTPLAIIVEAKDILLVNVHRKNNRETKHTRQRRQKENLKKVKSLVMETGEHPKTQRSLLHLPLKKFQNHHG